MKPRSRPRPAPPSPHPARNQVLAAWRGIDLEPLEKAAQSPGRSVADILPAVQKKIGFGQRQIEAEIVRVWNQTLDPTVVAHAQPASLRRGNLVVNVDSSVWLAELVRYRRQEILLRLQHAFGRDVIRNVHFRQA